MMNEEQNDNLFLFPHADQFEGKFAKIKCVGIGGGGGNAINHMMDAGIENVDFIAINTDAQDLKRSKAPYLVHLGEGLTSGLGVGGDPIKGKAAAEESLEQLKDLIANTDLLFITAGMGGGTGTGAAPVLARIAKETYGDDILVIGVVTRPFNFEGYVRAEIADKGIKELQNYVDSMLIVPNERLFEIIDPKAKREEAFKMVDDVLLRAVRGISEVILRPGEMNIDYNDLKSIMLNSKRSLIGTGIAKGQDRHLKAAEQALTSPLLEDADITGAKGLIVFTSTRNPDDNITMPQLNAVMNMVMQYASNKSKIKYGTMYDRNLPPGSFSVTVIATGFSGSNNAHLTSRGNLVSGMGKDSGSRLQIPPIKRPPHIGMGGITRVPRDSDLFNSKSEFKLIPAFIRRRREEK